MYNPWLFFAKISEYPPAGGWLAWQGAIARGRLPALIRAASRLATPA
jgi:hypothetical protein